MDPVISSDLATTASLLIGLAGFAVALWQVMKAKRARDMYKVLCESRCKNIVGSVRLLTGPVVQLCTLKDQHIDSLILASADDASSVSILRQISDQVHAIAVSKEELISFCSRLNDEHKAEFGAPVYADLDQVFLRRIRTLSVMSNEASVRDRQQEALTATG